MSLLVQHDAQLCLRCRTRSGGVNTTCAQPGKVSGPAIDFGVLACEPVEQAGDWYSSTCGLLKQGIYRCITLDVATGLKCGFVRRPAHDPEHITYRAGQCQLTALGLAFEFKSGKKGLRRLALYLQAYAAGPNCSFYIIRAPSPRFMGTRRYKKCSKKNYE